MHAKILLDQWVQYMQYKCPNSNISSDPKKFKGVELSRLSYFEKCFQTNVNVFRLQDDLFALPVYKLQCRFKDTIHLNLFDKHLSYNSNINGFTQKYMCPTCNMHFMYVQNMKRHGHMCQGRTKHQFPGGFYSSTKTIFDKQEEHDIAISFTEPFFPWFVVFDFEAILISNQEPKSEKLTWTTEHVPISVSIFSNVDGFQMLHCLVDPNTNKLVSKMVEYMAQICDKNYELAGTKFAEAFKKLDLIITSEENEVFEETASGEKSEYWEKVEDSIDHNVKILKKS